MHGAPIILDDACYFIPCETKEEAVFLCSTLNFDIAKTFIRSLVFFDAKRPITLDVLKRIDLKNLAARMNLGAKAASYLTDVVFESGQQPFLVFRK